MKNILTLAAVTALALTLSAPAFSAESTSDTETKVEKNDNGDYKAETTSKSEDSAGTATESEKKVEVDTGSNGDMEKTVTTEHSTDPKGLFNKKKTSTKDVIKRKGDKTVVKHKKKINGDTVEDSESTTEQQ
jgi:hypothetical protein